MMTENREKQTHMKKEEIKKIANKLKFRCKSHSCIIYRMPEIMCNNCMKFATIIFFLRFLYNGVVVVVVSVIVLFI